MLQIIIIRNSLQTKVMYIRKAVPVYEANIMKRCPWSFSCRRSFATYVNCLKINKLFEQIHRDYCRLCGSLICPIVAWFLPFFDAKTATIRQSN